MNTLKPCPFCGSADIRTEPGINLNYCDKCSAEANIEHWNTRPIEDALNKRIAELEAENDILKDHLREAKNILIDKNLQIDSLYEEGYKLQQRIAELEAERRWIPVSERLPENISNVLILSRGEQLIASYHSKYSLWYVPFVDKPVVTHWMPLPELPEVQE